MAQTSRMHRPSEADPDLRARVAVKAASRVAEAWGLGNAEAADLLDVSARTWARMKAGGWEGRLGRDQVLRLSALVGLYKGLHLYFSDPLADAWPKLANAGRLFAGATPVERMRAGGLPAMLEFRDYVDALRGGA